MGGFEPRRRGMGAKGACIAYFSFLNTTCVVYCIRMVCIQACHGTQPSVPDAPYVFAFSLRV